MLSWLPVAFAALSLQAAAADPSPDPASGSASDSGAYLDEAYEAWAAGDLVAAGVAAQLAMARLEADGCSVTPDGARLAWILGVAASFYRLEAPAGYWFWAAERIAGAAGGLRDDQAQAASRLASQPGSNASSDAWYAYSPYLGYGLTAQDCGAPDRMLMDPAIGAGDAAFVIVEVRIDRNLRMSRASLELAYPPAEGDALRDAVNGHHLATGGGYGATPRRFVFDPCTQVRDEAGEPVEVCRFSQRD
jgi:hypothetical protein